MTKPFTMRWRDKAGRCCYRGHFTYVKLPECAKRKPGRPRNSVQEFKPQSQGEDGGEGYCHKLSRAGFTYCTLLGIPSRITAATTIACCDKKCHGSTRQGRSSAHSEFARLRIRKLSNKNWSPILDASVLSIGVPQSFLLERVIG